MIKFLPCINQYVVLILMPHLYWLCRMLDGGVDPHYLARRIVRMSWEDIGLADPRGMQIANEAAQLMNA